MIQETEAQTLSKTPLDCLTEAFRETPSDEILHLLVCLVKEQIQREVK